jgi:hypothetical protein
MLRLERCWTDAAIRWHPLWPNHTRFEGTLLRPNDFGILLRTTMPTRGVSCKASDAYAAPAAIPC